MQIISKILFRAASHFPKVIYGTKTRAEGIPNRRPPVCVCVCVYVCGCVVCVGVWVCVYVGV